MWVNLTKPHSSGMAESCLKSTSVQFWIQPLALPSTLPSIHLAIIGASSREVHRDTAAGPTAQGDESQAGPVAEVEDGPPGWASAITCLILPPQHCRFFNPPRYAHHSSWCQCLCEDCQMIIWLKKKEAEKRVRGKWKWLNEHNAGLDSMSLGTHYDHLCLAWGAVWPLKRRGASVSGHSWLHSSLRLHVWVGKTILFSEPPVSSL